MKYVGIVRGDGLWTGCALKRRNLLPEEIQHRVGRSMPVMGAAVHLAAGDNVDARQVLIENRSLPGAVLRIDQRRHRQLPPRHQAIQRLVPIRHAVGPDHGSGIFLVFRHAMLLSGRATYQKTRNPNSNMRPDPAGCLCLPFRWVRRWWLNDSPLPGRLIEAAKNETGDERSGT